MEWILIIWMLGQGNYNYNPTVIEGFSSQQECNAAGSKATEIQDDYFRKYLKRTSGYTCVSRTTKKDK